MLSARATRQNLESYLYPTVCIDVASPKKYSLLIEFSRTWRTSKTKTWGRDCTYLKTLVKAQNVNKVYINIRTILIGVSRKLKGNFLSIIINFRDFTRFKHKKYHNGNMLPKSCDY